MLHSPWRIGQVPLMVLQGRGERSSHAQLCILCCPAGNKELLEHLPNLCKDFSTLLLTYTSSYFWIPRRFRTRMTLGKLSLPCQMFNSGLCNITAPSPNRLACKPSTYAIMYIRFWAWCREATSLPRIILVLLKVYTIFNRSLQSTLQGKSNN